MNLVTGATGIVGSHVLLNLLLDGQQVVASKRPGSDLESVREVFGFYGRDYLPLFDRIRWIELDILDYFAVEQALQGVETVYHCAGLVSFEPSDRKRLFSVNEGGTRNIVNACLHLGGIALCHTSTIGTLSNSDVRTLDESVFWKNSGAESAYALSKYNAEREVWRAMEEGLEAVIVNPGVIIAPVYWEQSSGKIFSRCHRGNLFYTSGSSAYISAMDAGAAMVKLMKSRQFGNRYILAEGNYDFKFILSRIQANFNRRPPLISVPRRLLIFTAWLGRLFGFILPRKPVLTRSLINAAFNRQLYSNARVKGVTGLTFEPIRDVLDKVCGYYLTVSARGHSKR